MAIILDEAGNPLLDESGKYFLYDEAGAPFPLAPLDLRAELNLAGVWTDVSAFAYQRAGTQSPVAITRGRPDETAKATPGGANVEFNDRDGRFSPKNPTGAYYGQLGRNTPMRLSVPAQANYLRLENDNAAQAFVNDTPALHITGSIEMRMAVQLTDWQGATLATFGACWVWYLTPAGFLGFAWEDSLSNPHTAISTLPVPYTGAMRALRVTMDATTGNTTFYTASTIDGTYAQLGAVVNPVGAATSILSATSTLQVGYDPSLTGSQPAQLRGRVAEYRLYNGIGGTVVADTVMSGVAAGSTSWTDSKGLAWSISGGAEVSSRDYRWHGETSSLPPRWDNTGTDIAVQVASGGLLRRLGQGQAPILSAMRRAIGLQPNLVQYWPMEDPAGASSFGSATGGPPMGINGAPTLASDSGFPGSSALPKLNGAQFFGRVPTYTSGASSFVVRALVHPGTSGTGSTLLQVNTNGTCTNVNVLYEGGSSLEITGSAGATSVFNSGVVSFASLPGGTLQQPLWMSLELTNGGGTAGWVLALLPLGATTVAQATGSFTGVPGNVSAVYIDPQGGLADWSVGHVSVQAGTLPPVSTLASPFNAWTGETAGARFARILGENGLTARVLGPAATTAPMGAQPVASLLSVLQECEDCDRGMIYEPRQVFGLAYRTLGSMLNQSPAVTLDYSQAQAGGTGAALEPTYDDQYVRNDETVTRGSPGGGGMTFRSTLNDGSAMSISQPPAGIGDYANSDTVNCQLDSQVPHLARWIVHAGTADVARWPAIPVNLARNAIQNNSLYYPLLALDVGDYLQVVNMLGAITADPVNVIVSGTRESLGGFHHEVAYNCAPESPFEVIVLDDVIRGRVDTDGSQLAAGVGSAATTLTVTTTGPSGILWTQAAADFPFDVNIGGERMTVTNIAASSPQPRGAQAFATATNTTTLAVTFPATLQAGDLMLIWCASNGSTAHTWTETPDGFTAVTATFVSTQFSCQLLYKTATSADASKAASSGTFTVTESSGQGDAWTAVAAAYYVAGGFDPSPSSSGNTGSGTSLAVTGITTTKSGDRLVWFGASGASSGGLPTITPPGGFTTQAAQVNSNTGSGTQICAIMADAVQGSAGATGTETGTLSASHGWAGLLVGISPSGPQTFTVTRSVNGVSKAQAMGADVRLWLPPTLSLI